MKVYYQKGYEVKGGNDANGGAEGGTGREWVHYCLITVHLEIISVDLQSGTFGGSNILELGSNILEPQNFIFNILKRNEEKKL